MLKQKTIEKKRTLTIPSTQALQKKDHGSSFITQQHSGGVLKPQPSEEPKNYKAQKPDSRDSKKISVEVIPESLQNSQTSLAVKVRDDQSKRKMVSRMPQMCRLRTVAQMVDNQLLRTNLKCKARGSKQEIRPGKTSLQQSSLRPSRTLRDCSPL